jgi:hypothetical protein
MAQGNFVWVRGDMTQFAHYYHFIDILKARKGSAYTRDLFPIAFLARSGNSI